MLRALKRNAARAGQDPDRYWLHKFRATFATMHLAAGVDLRTVQAWLGHSNLESTIRYLKPARGEAMREKVNGTFA
jgi:site-specific recombinase XerD